MLLGIDHIVIAGPDLDTLTATFKALGFNVVGGGRHPIGSYNSLIGLADGAYIELLSFYEDSPKHYWWEAVHSRGGGLIDFCMQTDDIRGDYAAFAAQGVEMSPLVGLSRVRFDGYQLSWLNERNLRAVPGSHPGFHGRRRQANREDETPREERVPKDKEHETASVASPASTASRWPPVDIGLAARVMTGSRFESSPEGEEC